jgi:beta-glucosidase-like glycosyl hydrolase
MRNRWVQPANLLFVISGCFAHGFAQSPLVRPSQSQCEEPQLQALPFCNTALPLSTRVEDLVARLNQTEKIGLMGAGSAVPRLGIAPLPFGEALHGVLGACYKPEKCPTSFPHALALAASFNRSLWLAVGDAISTEARALNNLAVHAAVGPGDPSQQPICGLMLWTPNLNPYRDPRWGRGHETPVRPGPCLVPPKYGCSRWMCWRVA